MPRWNNPNCGFQKGHKHSPQSMSAETKIKMSLAKSGERSPSWRGMEACKEVKHIYITRHYGSPKKCEHCGTTDAKNYDWASKDHKYSRDRKDYLRLCRSCHRKYDIKFNGYITNLQKWIDNKSISKTMKKIAETKRWKYWLKKVKENKKKKK